jgi:hypothetical protein
MPAEAPPPVSTVPPAATPPSASTTLTAGDGHAASPPSGVGADDDRRGLWARIKSKFTK